MSLISKYIQILSIVSISAFAGVMICVYTSHLVIWQQLQPEEFLAWFEKSSLGISHATGTIGIISLIFSFVSLVVSWKFKSNRYYGLLSFILLTSIIGITMLYFVDVNTSFSNKSVPLEEISETLNNWGELHIVRIVLSILSAISASIGLINNTSSENQPE